MTDRVYYEVKREGLQRCPKCGSVRFRITVDDLDDTIEMECADCGWISPAYADDQPREAPFIFPGELGSHDSQDDYPRPIET